MISNEYIVSNSKNVNFSDIFLDVFFSLAVLASCRLCATTKWSFFMSSMFIMLSSVPKYFGLSEVSRLCLTLASLLNIKKKGAIPEDSMGKKLYAAVAFQTKSSHSAVALW